MRHALSAAMLAASSLPLLADWNVHASIGSPPYDGYAPAEVVPVGRYVPLAEAPLVFVAARHARVRPVGIVDACRAGGWGLVCSRFGLPRQLLFAPVGPAPVVVYAPYGAPPKHLRRAPKLHRHSWR